MSDLAPIDLATATTAVTTGAYSMVETAQGYLKDRNVQIAIAVCIVAIGGYYYYSHKKAAAVVAPEPALYQAEVPAPVDVQFASPLENFNAASPDSRSHPADSGEIQQYAPIEYSSEQ